MEKQLEDYVFDVGNLLANATTPANERNADR
jgi:hypothetical protein